MPIIVRRLLPNDAEKLFQLRREALVEEPFAFLYSPQDDPAASPAAMRDQLSSRPDCSAVIGAFSDDELIGMVGIT